jgi:hypothetical protein
MGSVPQPTVNARCPECSVVVRTEAGLRIHRRKVHQVVITEKVCTRCKVNKTLDQYKPVRAGKTYSSWCRDCIAEKAREWRKDRPGSHVRRDRKKNIQSRFGITVEEYDMLWGYFMDRQGGTCATCSKEPLHMDHCHTSGRIRGALCRECNLALGYMQDDKEIAAALLQYLVSR